LLRQQRRVESTGDIREVEVRTCWLRHRDGQ
jgi:hypothetical protein